MDETGFNAFPVRPEWLAEVTGGTVVRRGSQPIRGLSTDSRSIRNGQMFVALRGETTDGHRYLDAALEAGASCLLAEEFTASFEERIPETVTAVRVGDTLAALGAVAHAYRMLRNPLVFAVTGSVGKTTTRQMLHAVLSRRFRTLCTERNFNNEIGLPMTLLRLEEGDEAAVLEAGMNHAGELSRLSRICEPDCVLITNIGTAHIENLGSREGIRDAKLELLEGMPAGGTVVFSGDEPLLTEKREEMIRRGLRPVTFSVHGADADYRAENVEMTGGGSVFSILETSTGKRFSDLSLRLPGLHNVADAAAVVACACAYGIPEELMREGLVSFVPLRQEMLSVGDWTVILDCYNASPESVKAELGVLASVAAGKESRPVAVLGDMLELGEHSASLHREVGAAAAESCKLLFTFGPKALDIAAGAADAGLESDRIYSVPELDDPEALAERISGLLQPGDTVLFKASHAVALERVFELLRREAEEGRG